MTIGRTSARLHDYLEKFVSERGKIPPMSTMRMFLGGLSAANVNRMLASLQKQGFLDKDYKPTGTLEKTRRPWSDEDIEKLHELVHTTKMSAREIAAHFPGKTRNAVIGFVNRQGWKLAGSGTIKKKKVNKEPYKRPSRAAPRPTEGFRRRTPPERFDAPPVRLEGHETTPFIDLEPTQCRFCVEDLHKPVTPQMACCGARVLDRFGGALKASYCELHYEASTRSRYD
jgi:hypothetical protein